MLQPEVVTSKQDKSKKRLVKKAGFKGNRQNQIRKFIQANLNNNQEKI